MEAGTGIGGGRHRKVQNERDFDAFYEVAELERHRKVSDESNLMLFARWRNLKGIEKCRMRVI